MRLSINPTITRVGDVEIRDPFRVTELDAGHLARTDKSVPTDYGNEAILTQSRNICFSQAAIHSIETQMGIAIPCMNEDLEILMGVFLGVPHDCLIILVSNSDLDHFKAECELLANHCNCAQRQGIAVHQQDPGLAYAFYAAGLPELVEHASPNNSADNCSFRIRSGKGEAMMIGAAIAKLYEKKFIGFIDADNYTAGSILEYCKVYAAGLHYALPETNLTAPLEPAHVMVRIKWNSKPKPRGDKIIFEKSGRSSRVVNEWMNRFLNELAVGDSKIDCIHTGNAGEHAMSIELATKLRFATGYAVEPFQLINALEQFGMRGPGQGKSEADVYASLQDTPRSSITEALKVDLSHNSVQVLQIQTCNPHFHDTSKGDSHIARMQVQGLSTIYHSHLTSKELQEELRIYMKGQFPGYVDPDGVPMRMRDYPPLGTMDWKMLGALIPVKAKSLVRIGF